MADEEIIIENVLRVRDETGDNFKKAVDWASRYEQALTRLQSQVEKMEAFNALHNPLIGKEADQRRQLQWAKDYETQLQRLANPTLGPGATMRRDAQWARDYNEALKSLGVNISSNASFGERLRQLTTNVSSSATTMGRSIETFANQLTGGGGFLVSFTKVIDTLAGTAATITTGVFNAAGSLISGVGSILSTITSAAASIASTIGGILSGILGAIFSVPGALIGGGAVAGGVIWPLEVAAGIDTMRISMEAFEGSTERANNVMAGLMNLAIHSPYTFADLANAAVRLEAVGIRGGRAQEITKAIATAAYATRPNDAEAQMQRLVLPFQQALERGTFGGDQLRELTRAGVPALQILAKEFGYSTIEMKQFVENGAVPARRAMLSIVEAINTGKYPFLQWQNILEVQQHSLRGLTNSLKDIFQNKLLYAWGEGISQGIIPNMQKLVDWFDNNNEVVVKLQAALQQLGQTLGSYLSDRLADLVKVLGDWFTDPAFLNAPDALSKLGYLGGRALNFLLDKMGPIGTWLRAAYTTYWPQFTNAMRSAWDYVTTTLIPSIRGLWTEFNNAFMGGGQDPGGIRPNSQGGIMLTLKATFDNFREWIATNGPMIVKNLQWLATTGFQTVATAAGNALSLIGKFGSVLGGIGDTLRRDPAIWENLSTGWSHLSHASIEMADSLDKLFRIFGAGAGGQQDHVNNFLDFLAKVATAEWSKYALGVDLLGRAFGVLAMSLDKLASIDYSKIPSWAIPPVVMPGVGGLGLSYQTPGRGTEMGPLTGGGAPLTTLQSAQALAAAGFDANTVAYICGPLAAEGIAKAFQIAVDPQMLEQKARSAGWSASGMGGPGNFMKLLSSLGIESHFGSINEADAAFASGRPVAYDTPGHYFLLQGHGPNGTYDTGNTGLAYRGGSRYLTIAQMNALGGMDDRNPWIIPNAVSPMGSGSGGGIEQYIRMRAASLGIDPNQAVRVAMSEGGVTEGARAGDQGSSFGPFQLHYGHRNAANWSMGMGDAFTAQTGLNAADPSTWQAQVDFALNAAAQGSWSPWHGWKGDPWAGINRRGVTSQGVGSEKGGDMGSGITVTINVDKMDLSNAEQIGNIVAARIASAMSHMDQNIGDVPGGYH